MPPDVRPAPELTPRALASGLLVGALLCVANLYMGLKTGIADSGHVTASVLVAARLTSDVETGNAPETGTKLLSMSGPSASP